MRDLLRGCLIGAAFCCGYVFSAQAQYTNSATVALPGSPLQTSIDNAGGGLPAGLIVATLTTCPTGFTESSALNGQFLIGTLAGNGNVGGTGGADNITPAGTNSAPAFTGNSFSSVINHTHPVTDPGHVHVENNNSATTGGLAGWAARDTSTSTSVATGYSTASATTGVTTSNPVGGVASITPTGTVAAPTFTGTQFDNRPAFTRVIFCVKD